ncbi:uncharacterized protein [Amphiura filiformis]|uniref:uncharacterized protein n=1 Tax=Amphiura filiformis TaxID=82378 RepID=UPI003B2248D1
MNNMCRLPVLILVLIPLTYGATTTRNPFEDWLHHRETCATMGHECQYGAECVDDYLRGPRCECDTGCPITLDPICDTEGNTHINLCELRSFSCQLQKIVSVAYYGECKELTCEGYCYNGATCEYLLGTPFCTCTNGYVGLRCDTDLNFDAWPIPTLPPIFDNFDDHNWQVDVDNDNVGPQEFVEDAGTMWVAMSVAIGVIVLGMMFGMLLYVVKQRRRRRVVVVRTVQGKHIL